MGLWMRPMPGLRAARRRLCPFCEGLGMTNEKRRWTEGVVFLVLFGLTIPAGNWLIGNFGTQCAPKGPCLIPVAPGIMAPSGVLMIGIALVLRDLVQRRLGVVYSVGAVLAGASISAALAPPALVLAS